MRCSNYIIRSIFINTNIVCFTEVFCWLWNHYLKHIKIIHTFDRNLLNKILLHGSSSFFISNDVIWVGTRSKYDLGVLEVGPLPVAIIETFHFLLDYFRRYQDLLTIPGVVFWLRRRFFVFCCYCVISGRVSAISFLLLFVCLWRTFMLFPPH